MKDCSNGCSAPFAADRGSEVAETFRAKDLIITPATVLKEKPDPDTLVFGASFTDHMLIVEWSSASGWEKPHIKPFENLSIHPAASVLHYAVELFEGLKAFRGVDNKIRLFRPDLNMRRMCRSAVRTTLPVFDQEELLECIRQLIQIDQEWVPYSTSASLYIRPTFIGTEPSLGVKKPSKALLFVVLSPVGPYFSSGTFKPVSLWANPKYVRAWEGGTGDCKMGGNYGASLLAQCEAMENGCQQVLWLYGQDNQITEVGTMNLFLYWINEHGEEELATPPLDGIILPGVTRQSIIELAQQWVGALDPDNLLKPNTESSKQAPLCNDIIPCGSHQCYLIFKSYLEQKISLEGLCWQNQPVSIFFCRAHREPAEQAVSVRRASN